MEKDAYSSGCADILVRVQKLEEWREGWTTSGYKSSTGDLKSLDVRNYSSHRNEAARGLQIELLEEEECEQPRRSEENPERTLVMHTPLSANKTLAIKYSPYQTAKGQGKAETRVKRT